MQFNINTDEAQPITDMELSEILSSVYVGGGFTELDVADKLFEPSTVRERGILITAREKQTLLLAGIVMIVPAESPASCIAQGAEAEMHLLAVKSGYRRRGLGKMLVDEVIKRAKKNGYSKMILWTQTSMKTAQNLYESKDFVHIKDVNRNECDFLVYEKLL